MSYLIVGNGAAGYMAAMTIKRSDPSSRVLAVSDEPYPAYYRPLLTNLFGAGALRDAILVNRERMAEGVEHRNGETVIDLDPENKRLLLEGGEELNYQKLLLATGSSAIRLDLPGGEGPGVYTIRTLAEAEMIAHAAKQAKRVVIIGGGRIGMKTAAVLVQQGLIVTVIEQMQRLVPQQLDDVASEMLLPYVASQGIVFISGQTVREVVREGGRVRSVVLSDDRKIEANLIIQAVGTRPNLTLAKQGNLLANIGVVVDEYLQTSDPHIYAAGDVVETTDLIGSNRIVSGLWTNAVQMGRLAGQNMIGAHNVYEGAFEVLNSLEVGGKPTISVGVVNPPKDSNYKEYQKRVKDRYKKLVLRDGILVGAILVDDIDGAGVYTGLIRRKADVSEHIDLLMSSRPSYAPWFKHSTV